MKSSIALAAAAVAAAFFSLDSGLAGAQSAPPARSVTIDPDGTARLQNATIPLSSMLSAESKQILRNIQPSEGPRSAPQTKTEDMAELRRKMNEGLQPRVKHSIDLFKVDVEEATIDGISVAIVTPKGGVPERNKNRLMINAPGGGFRTGIRANGLLISIPVSAAGQFKVISLLYRQGPEHKFPAATEDFTKVYKAMLKTYKPANIGFVGCSAGGALIAQMVAHLINTGMPRPGVLGVYCAGLSSKFEDGDSVVFTELATGNPRGQVPGRSYFEGVNLDDPLVTPANNLALLAKFPPTLFAVATRDFSMSAAAYSYRRLLKAGIESDLLIYDGLGHGFMTNPDYPESRDLYEIAARFYDKHLGR